MTTFYSSIQSLTFFITIDGNKRCMRFSPKGRPLTFGYLYVTDPAEIEAIRKHPMFGTIITEDDATAKKEEVAQREYAAVYPDVKRTQEANAILKAEPYNIDAARLKSKAEALKIADELNISFPNLK